MRKALAINGQNVPIQVAWPALSKFYCQRGSVHAEGVLECGGKRSATPLWIVWSTAFRRL